MEKAADPVIESRVPDRRGRTVRTLFSGAELIREKAIVDGVETIRVSIRMATINHEGVIITSPLLVLEAGGARGRLENGVQIEDPKSKTTIRAARAIYERLEQKVRLEGNPQLHSRNARDGDIRVTTRLMERDLSASISYFKEDVRISGRNFIVLADQGRLVDEERKLYVEKDPLIFSPGSVLSGENLIYHLDEAKLSLDRDVVQLSYQEEKVTTTQKRSTFSLEEFARMGGRPPENFQESSSDSIHSLTAGRMDYLPGNADRGAVIEVFEDVEVKQGGLHISSAYFMAGGPDLSEIYTREKVVMVDRKENVAVRAGEMHYDRNAKRLRLEKEPVIEFLKEGSDEVTASLAGRLIERSFADGRTQARGSVVIIRDQLRLEGELATYHEAEDIVVLEGRPSLRDGDSRIYCEKILMFPRRGRLLLQNRIKGFLLN
ncbi:MAG: hypothetical protein HS115_08680 [Spirochaetales bacterium]|nr:hypothetical protein [Spirochaetales bacterium]